MNFTHADAIEGSNPNDITVRTIRFMNPMMLRLCIVVELDLTILQ